VKAMALIQTIVTEFGVDPAFRDPGSSPQFAGRGRHGSTTQTCPVRRPAATKHKWAVVHGRRDEMQTKRKRSVRRPLDPGRRGGAATAPFAGQRAWPQGDDAAPSARAWLQGRRRARRCRSSNRRRPGGGELHLQAAARRRMGEEERERESGGGEAEAARGCSRESRGEWMRVRLGSGLWAFVGFSSMLG